jgi:hypothetical protein
MSSALLTGLFAILGTGLAGTSASCWVLWRRVRALTSASATVSIEAVRRPASALPPGEGPGVRVAASPPIRKRGLQAGHSTRHDPHPGPFPGGEGGRGTIGNDELARRVDELLGKHRALEARLARLESSSTAPVAPGAIAARPRNPRSARRVDPGTLATLSGPTLISVPDLTAPPASNSEAAAELDRRFGPVWAMADEGMPIDAIARETGYPIGQVELILGLRRRLLAGEAGPDA